MESILISGLSGFVGLHLARFLQANTSYTIIGVGRERKTVEGFPVFAYSDMDQSELWKETQFKAFIHLAGASIGEGKWTAARKASLLASRVDQIPAIHEFLDRRGAAQIPVISASGIGYYAANGVVPSESSPKGNGFLSDLSAKWEEGVRTWFPHAQFVRTGLVVGKGGILEKLNPLIRFGVLSPIGTGKQGMSWIAMDDLVRIYHLLLENPKLKVVNAVAPKAISNTEWTKHIMHHFGKKVLFPKVPGWLMYLVLGEQATLVVDGAYVASAVLDEFAFSAPSIKEALMQTG